MSSIASRVRRQKQQQRDDDKLTFMLPPDSKSEVRLKGFQDGRRRKAKAAMEFDDNFSEPLPSARQVRDESSDEEYEETLLYVDLDDIPSVDELFAVEPDDFLTCQSKKQREFAKPKKPLRSQLPLKFYNLDSSSPILQIGSRYYTGVYEDAMGSCLMFQDKATSKDEAVASSSSRATTKAIHKNKLTSIVAELRPPKDKVFGESLCKDIHPHPDYDLVANVHKVLKMKRQEVHFHGEDPKELPATPGTGPVPDPARRLKLQNIVSKV